MDNCLIVGLGNPGLNYAGTRHNAGFLLVDRLVTHWQAREEKAGGPYILWSIDREGQRIYLMKPLTYMNASGTAVGAFLRRCPVALSRIMIVYDDVALPLGCLRVRPSGSAGGQKGMHHIIEVLESRDIPRLRMGIDSEGRSGPLPDFVLTPFAEEEIPIMRETLSQALEAVECWLVKEMAAVMAQFNARVATSKNTEGISSLVLEEKVE